MKILVLGPGGIDRSKPNDNIAQVRVVPDLPNPPNARPTESPTPD